jgi:hypothetical protein
VGSSEGLDQPFFVCFAGPHPRRLPALAALAPLFSSIGVLGSAICPTKPPENADPSS